METKYSYLVVKLEQGLLQGGSAGKIRLNSNMTKEEIFAKFRSVFSKAMRNEEDFQFDILQSAGGGTKSLTIPCRSSIFKYKSLQLLVEGILAKDDIFLVKDEEKVLNYCSG